MFGWVPQPRELAEQATELMIGTAGPAFCFNVTQKQFMAIFPCLNQT